MNATNSTLSARIPNALTRAEITEAAAKLLPGEFDNVFFTPDTVPAFILCDMLARAVEAGKITSRDIVEAAQINSAPVARVNIPGNPFAVEVHPGESVVILPGGYPFAVEASRAEDIAGGIPGAVVYVSPSDIAAA